MVNGFGHGGDGNGVHVMIGPGPLIITADGGGMIIMAAGSGLLDRDGVHIGLHGITRVIFGAGTPYLQGFMSRMEHR